jgi:phosphopantothenoylcysteine decarboxylase/phosphopantothenate--cysteine ligase
LGKTADLVLVAPATANMIGTYRAGMANDLLSSILIATKAPVIVCPAMHTEMYENIAVQDNMQVLRDRGVIFVDAEVGSLARNDVGKGRLADLEKIVAVVKRTLGSNECFRDKTVTVTAGGTREFIDPVRYITNRSSGKQGIAIALEAYYRGAKVNLITANSNIPSYLLNLENFEVRRVDTAQEMADAVLSLSQTSDLIVMAAAVADFRVKNQSKLKLHRQDGLPKLELQSTVDIISELVALRNKNSLKSKKTHWVSQRIVGFAAETDNLTDRAMNKLKSKAIDMLVANDVSRSDIGFDTDSNAVTIYTSNGFIKEVDKKSKQEIAEEILNVFELEFNN